GGGHYENTKVGGKCGDFAEVSCWISFWFVWAFSAFPWAFQGFSGSTNTSFCRCLIGHLKKVAPLAILILEVL
ncbi:MAG: hypothetical protein IJ100_08960, partial [Lachnospiraceae bacterium]|nr:hypothetical protein [Lachnospiraceae bacterium]